MPRLDKETYGRILTVQDALVKLHNRFHEINPDIRMAWDISPSLGVFSVRLYVGGKQPKIDRGDCASWIYGDERDGESYQAMVEKINEWKARYGLQ